MTKITFQRKIPSWPFELLDNRGEGKALFSFHIAVIVMQIFGDKSNLLKEKSEGEYVAYIFFSFPYK